METTSSVGILIPLAALLAPVPLAGCVEALDTESASVGVLARDCVVPPGAGVGDWGPPVSVDFPQGSLWLFDSVAVGGEDARGVGALVRDADDACTGAIDLVRNDEGTPLPLLALTEAERAENDARDDGRRLVLSPSAGFVHDGRGYLFYEHVLVGPGFFDAESLGAGLCRFDAPDTPCERLTDGGGANTRLWAPDAWPVRSAFVADGSVHAVLCRQVASFDVPCIVAAAPVADLGVAGAYRYYDAFGGWVEDAAGATIVLEHLGPVTFGWNEYQRRYTAVLMDLFEAHVSMRVAPKPTGPFDDTFQLFDGIPPASNFVGGGVEHPALRGDGGRTIHVSYTTNANDAPGLHLATFRFHGRLR